MKKVSDLLSGKKRGEAAKLSRTLNVKEGIVSRWLSGKAQPSRKMAAKIAKLFNVRAVIQDDGKIGFEPRKRGAK